MGMVDDDLMCIGVLVCGACYVLNGRSMLACWHVGYEGTCVGCCVAAMVHRMYVAVVSQRYGAHDVCGTGLGT
jgi:hypothetical protein